MEKTSTKCCEFQKINSIKYTEVLIYPAECDYYNSDNAVNVDIEHSDTHWKRQCFLVAVLCP